MDKNKLNHIPAEKFKFVGGENASHDVKFDTKARSFMQDAFSRFCKNKGSVVAAVVIAILVLFSIVVPPLTPFTVAYEDNDFSYALPKNPWFENTNFWDGCEEVTAGDATWRYLYQIGAELENAEEGKGGHYAIKNQQYVYDPATGLYKYRRDSYHKTGTYYESNMSPEEYQSIIEYQNTTKRQVLYPLIDDSNRPTATQDEDDANYYYKTKKVGSTTVAVLDDNGNVIPVYELVAAVDGAFVPRTRSQNGNTIPEYNSLRIEGQDGIMGDGSEHGGATGTKYYYCYAFEKSGSYEVRYNIYEYYVYQHALANDGISDPYFIFGTTKEGKDILTCLAGGARFSFLFAIAVAVINLFIGAIWGSIAGYYGGATDIIMERITDILAAIPMMVVITLLKEYLDNVTNITVLFLAFIATGWIGMASSTRMQFYRYKNHEYVLAARTLGARDARIMFKHIFPNALGTLVTGCALIIPSMIFSETSLTYLGIVNLSVGNITSVGTLIALGQPSLMSYPYVVAFPSIFLALLMLSFNLFGNGLRDAFNPSLRGTED